jgi:hypothetical protein
MKIKYTFKHGEEIIKETYDIPINLEIYEPVSINSIDYIITRIGVEAKSCDHTIYLIPRSEFKSPVIASPVQKVVVRENISPKDMTKRTLQYRKRLPEKNNKWSNWLTEKVVFAHEAQEMLDEVQTNGNRAYQYRIKPKDEGVKEGVNEGVKEAKEVKTYMLDPNNEGIFEIQYQERDSITKQFGDWITLKTFSYEEQRNDFFTTMEREAGRRYKIKN